MEEEVNDEKQKKKRNLYYESNPIWDRHPCGECGSKQYYTRIYVNEKTDDAVYLCYNCADNFITYRGYQELVVEATYS